MASTIPVSTFPGLPPPVSSYNLSLPVFMVPSFSSLPHPFHSVIHTHICVTTF
ncbi:hypothetical protein ACRRTK_004955 [Alexandromys fortis]